MSLFQPATRKKLKLRLALVGPTGSGKTYTALRIAMAIAKAQGGLRVALADSEHRSASKYVGEVDNDDNEFQFDVVDLGSLQGRFSVENYRRVIHEAAQGGYGILVIDSLSHAWAGPGGLLEFVDQQAKKNRGNSFAGWRDATPLHNMLIDDMLAAPLHLIVTMRSKTEWVMEPGRNGKTAPRKVGMQPVQRDGLEYEFDVVGDMEADTHSIMITKSRCSAVADAVIQKPGARFAQALVDWLDAGDEPDAPPVREPEPMRPPDANGWGPERFAAAVSEAGLDYAGSVRPFMATRTKGKKLPEDMAPAELERAAAWLCNGGGAKVAEMEAELRGQLRTAFMARWSKLYPIPAQRDGATKEEQDAAKARSAKLRGRVMIAWWGVDSLAKVTPHQILGDDNGKTLAWLRGVMNVNFAAAVDAVIPSGEQYPVPDEAPPGHSTTEPLDDDIPF
jgi:hypothetical protein